MKMIRKILFFVFLFAGCYSFQHEFTIYSEENYLGDSVTVRSKQRDLLPLAPSIISTSGSYCYRGDWFAYSSKDYMLHKVWHWGDGTVRCVNSTVMRTIASLRYMGPSETDIESISFYSLTDFGNVELIIDRAAYANIPFSPGSLVSTAWSNWTLYSGSNFDGTAICFRSTAKRHGINLNSTFGAQIKSVLKDCNRRIDTYLYADALDTQTDQITDAI